MEDMIYVSARPVDSTIYICFALSFNHSSQSFRTPGNFRWALGILFPGLKALGLVAFSFTSVPQTLVTLSRLSPTSLLQLSSLLKLERIMYHISRMFVCHCRPRKDIALKPLSSLPEFPIY